MVSNAEVICASAFLISGGGERSPIQGVSRTDPAQLSGGEGGEGRGKQAEIPSTLTLIVPDACGCALHWDEDSLGELQ